MGNLNCSGRAAASSVCEQEELLTRTSEISHTRSESTSVAVRRIVSEGDLLTQPAAAGGMKKSVSFNNQVQQFLIPIADNPQDLWWSKDERAQMAIEAKSESTMKRSVSVEFNQTSASGRVVMQRSVRAIRRLENRLRVPETMRLSGRESEANNSLYFNPQVLANHAGALARAVETGQVKLPGQGRMSDTSEVVAMFKNIQSELQAILN